jgi:sirohydrochlorin cobaltochelatase
MNPKITWPGSITILALIVLLLAGLSPAAAQDKPAVVLTAFGTTTAAADTYQHIDKLARQRFPDLDIRWAYTSRIVRKKVAAEQGRELKDLAQVLQELKTAGVTKVAVQSLHVVPGEEWDKKIVAEAGKVPGLKLALGQPLLSAPRDHERVLTGISKLFPADLAKTAVVLAGHGSPAAAGEAAYLAFEKLLRSRYAGKNVFLGVVGGKPEAAAALAAIKRSQAQKVVFIPFMVVAGDHMDNDVLGDDPKSWKAQLLKVRPFKVDAVRRGLGLNDDVVAVFLDHLAAALETLK